MEYEKRELKEIEFAHEYVERYNHGTPGHLDLTIIHKQAAEIEELRERLAAIQALPTSKLELELSPDVVAQSPYFWRILERDLKSILPGRDIEVYNNELFGGVHVRIS